MIEGNGVKRAGNVKFPGVSIDDRLSFKNRVSGLQKQMPIATGILNRFFSNLVPFEAKVKAYCDSI